MNKIFLSIAVAIAAILVASSSLFIVDQSQVAVVYFKATPANPRIDTPHLFAINPAGMIVQDWSDSSVGAMLAAKGGAAAAIQALIASAPK